MYLGWSSGHEKHTMREATPVCEIFWRPAASETPSHEILGREKFHVHVKFCATHSKYLRNKA